MALGRSRECSSTRKPTQPGRRLLLNALRKQRAELQARHRERLAGFRRPVLMGGLVNCAELSITTMTSAIICLYLSARMGRFWQHPSMAKSFCGIWNSSCSHCRFSLKNRARTFIVSGSAQMDEHSWQAVETMRCTWSMWVPADTGKCEDTKETSFPLHSVLMVGQLPRAVRMAPCGFGM